jgi:TonB family protein
MPVNPERERNQAAAGHDEGNHGIPPELAHRSGNVRRQVQSSKQHRSLSFVCIPDVGINKYIRCTEWHVNPPNRREYPTAPYSPGNADAASERGRASATPGQFAQPPIGSTRISRGGVDPDIPRALPPAFSAHLPQIEAPAEAVCMRATHEAVGSTNLRVPGLWRSRAVVVPVLVSGYAALLYGVAHTRAGVERSVVLDLLMDERGQPVEVVLAQGSGPSELDEATSRAAKLWRLSPPRFKSRPVEVWGHVEVRYEVASERTGQVGVASSAEGGH